jgi:tight adherence protein B
MIPAAVFVVVLALVLLPYVVFVTAPEDREHRKLKKRLKATTRARAGLALLKAVDPLSSVGVFNRALARTGRTVEPTRRLLERAGMRINLGTYLLACGCAAALPFFIVNLVTGSPLAGLIVGACTGCIPYVWVCRARSKRMWKFEEQFPEAIDLIARALRAGHTFQTGLAMVAEELADPVGTEFKLLYDRQNFGMPLAEALRSFAQRIPLLDAKFFATAVLTQRDAGGNLAEVLDNLTSVIRDRFKVKRQVRVISAHGRITGWVLAGLPPGLSAVFMIVTPKHMQTLFNDPLGIQFIIAALFLQVVGTLAIRKIVNIEY